MWCLSVSTLAELIRELFACLNDPEFVAANRLGDKAFTRVRKVSFARLVMLLLNQLNGGLQREAEGFFEQCVGASGEGWSVVHTVSSAAVSKARKALNAFVFVRLNARLMGLVDQQLSADRRWFGHRIMAVDGSQLSLPDTEELRGAFGAELQQSTGPLKARLSQLYDVGSGLSYHTSLQPMYIGERTCAVEHLEHAPADALILYDRGYPSHAMLVWHRHFQREFCMRVPRGFNRQADALFAGEAQECEILLRPNSNAKAECGAQVDTRQPLRLRLVRVVLSSGEVEVVATSLLDTEAYPAHHFQALYALRWHVEVDYRRQKARLKMENFSGKKLHCIQQDVFAGALAKNLAMLIKHCAETQHQQHHPRHAEQRPAKVSFTDTLHWMKHALAAWVLKRQPLEALHNLVQKLQRYIHYPRPGRTSPRKPASHKRPNRCPMQYKSTR